MLNPSSSEKYMCLLVVLNTSSDIDPNSAGIDFSQILTTEVDPRTVRRQIFVMAVEP